MAELTLKKLQSAFKMEILSGEDKLASTQITVYGLNRAGLELTGYIDSTSFANRRVVLMSSKESGYMMQFSLEEKVAKYRKLMESHIPGIILTQKFQDVDALLQAAKVDDFPVLTIKSSSTSALTQRILDYYDNFFAPQIEEHGSLVNIFGKGVLILGKSGIGKSEMVLDLINNNHLFVGDDRIILSNKNSTIFGESHPILKNLIEVRGIGIMDFLKTNGYKSIMDWTTVDLIVELIDFKADGVDDSERLGKKYQLKKILGVGVPYIKIPVSAGRNLSNVVESAVAQLKLIQSGNAEDIVKLMNRRIQKGQGN